MDAARAAETAEESVVATKAAAVSAEATDKSAEKGNHAVWSDIPLKQFQGWGPTPTPLDITVIPKGGVLQTPMMTRGGPCPHLPLGITAQY